jgi:hypothetical protein
VYGCGKHVAIVGIRKRREPGFEGLEPSMGF